MSVGGAAAIVRHIERRGDRAFAFLADVFEQGRCAELVEAAVNTFGRVDIFVIGPGGSWRPDPIGQLN